MSLDVVSTGGSQFRVERADGSLVSEHATQHVAVESAANESRALGGAVVYVRCHLELRVSLTPCQEPEPPAPVPGDPQNAVAADAIAAHPT